MAAAASSGDSFSPKVAYMRLAEAEDAPMVLTLVRELAAFEELLHECVAAEEDLRSSITAAAPFKGPTVVLLEVAEAVPGGADEDESQVALDLKGPITDPDQKAFVSCKDAKRTVVGFVLVFPTFSTFLAKTGLWVDDLFIRAPYRRHGFGRMLLGFIATTAAKKDLGRVEWVVLDWNTKAIKFYESMGAVLNPEWKICRLVGETLKAYANK